MQGGCTDCCGGKVPAGLSVSHAVDLRCMFNLASAGIGCQPHGRFRSLFCTGWPPPLASLVDEELWQLLPWPCLCQAANEISCVVMAYGKVVITCTLGGTSRSCILGGTSRSCIFVPGQTNMHITCNTRPGPLQLLMSNYSAVVTLHVTWIMCVGMHGYESARCT